MLKKLYKHEFSYMYKFASVIYLILIGLTFFNAILMKFTNEENFVLNIIKNITFVTYTVGIFAVIFGTIILIFVRFYRHFFTSQGYLTFTLPFTATQHLVCKFVTSFCLSLTTLFTVYLSVEILTSFSGINGITETIRNLIVNFQYDGMGRDIVLVLTYCVLVVVSWILVIFALLCIGQLFKNRIIGTIIAFVGYYFITQIFSTILLVSLINYNELELLSNFEILYHSFIWVYISYNAVLAVVAFLLSRHILKNKLNLE